MSDTVAEVVELLKEQLSSESFTDYDKSMLIERSARSLQRACYCAEGVCCQVHDEHSSPHQHCLLR